MEDEMGYLNTWRNQTEGPSLIYHTIGLWKFWNISWIESDLVWLKARCHFFDNNKNNKSRRIS